MKYIHKYDIYSKISLCSYFLKVSLTSGLLVCWFTVAQLRVCLSKKMKTLVNWLRVIKCEKGGWWKVTIVVLIYLENFIYQFVIEFLIMYLVLDFYLECMNIVV